MDNRYWSYKCPPKMSDGQFITNHVRGSVFDQYIRNMNDIQGTHQYRNFLQNRGGDIMELEKKALVANNTCKLDGNCPSLSGKGKMNVLPCSTCYSLKNKEKFEDEFEGGDEFNEFEDADGYEEFEDVDDYDDVYNFEDADEYEDFEDSGDLEVVEDFENEDDFEDFRNTRGRVIPNKTLRTKAHSATGIKTVHGSRGRPRAGAYSTGKNAKSKINTVHGAGKHLIKKVRKTVKKGAKRVTHTSAKGRKGKYKHRFISGGGKTVATSVGKLITSKPSIIPSFMQSITPSFMPSIMESITPSFIPFFIQPSTSSIPTTEPSIAQTEFSLPILSNPTVSINKFSRVQTTSKIIDSKNVGYRYDPRSNFGVNFTESVEENTYQPWEKLSNGIYVPRDISSFTEVIKLILEINPSKPPPGAPVAKYNQVSGVYTLSSISTGAEIGLRYDPKSHFGVDFGNSNRRATYQPWIADSKGSIVALEIEDLSEEILKILRILPETPPVTVEETKVVPVSVIKFNPDPNLIYRVTDTGASTTGKPVSHFVSSSEIILDSRTPNFDGSGNLKGFDDTPAPNPVVGSIIRGPFVKTGTYVISVINLPSIPSNSSIPGTLVILNKPLSNIKEELNDVFTFTFSKTKVSLAESENIMFRQDPAVLYRITDIGVTNTGKSVSHFPSPTQIMLDTRSPIIDLSGNVIEFGPTANTPQIGSTITGPFIAPNTKVVGIKNVTNIPSDLSVPGQIITISNPLVNVLDDEGNILVYTFMQKLPSGSTIKLNSALMYRATDNGSDKKGNFITHFPTSTQILLDSRKPTFYSDGVDFESNAADAAPKNGATINGPFIQVGTTVTGVENVPLPSDSTKTGQIINISNPLSNVVEKQGDIFTYTFTQ